MSANTRLANKSKLSGYGSTYREVEILIIFPFSFATTLTTLLIELLSEVFTFPE